jgi:DMSO reductase anchor subunit
MHPAYSVIIFTTASGAGYGLLAVMALFAAAGALPADRWFALCGFVLAFGAITGGLLSSTFHLGHPERAWRALSQWRSSWLSREGVMAIGTYVPALALAWGMVVEMDHTGPWRMMAVATALLSAFTVYCTAMIYASLRPIRAWFNHLTVPYYLTMALWTGTLWLNVLSHLFGSHSPHLGMLLVIAGFLAFFVKIRYRRLIDNNPSWVSPESATGLGNLGIVRLLDAPNTQESYVQTEMGFKIARAHARKLRAIGMIGLFYLPLPLAVFTMEAGPWIAIPGALLAAVIAMVGALTDRWLFFAEAKHTAMLYWGAEDS